MRRAQACDADLSAFCDERPGDRETNASRTTGHERDFSSKRFHA
jgi:hypothetical protein